MGKRCGLPSGYVLEGTVMVSQSDHAKHQFEYNKVLL